MATEISERERDALEAVLGWDVGPMHEVEEFIDKSVIAPEEYTHPENELSTMAEIARALLALWRHSFATGPKDGE